MILPKIEAKEACDWLKAAGFPQYVQLFRDCQFPVDIDWVKRDHEFLDKDAIDSLCRRLNTLNKCVEVKLETHRSRRRSEESDEEDPCAISGKWSFERRNRRWSRQEGVEFLPSPDDTLAQQEVEFPYETRSQHSSSGSESPGRGVTPKKTDEESGDPEMSQNSSTCCSTSLDSSRSFSAPPSPSSGDTPPPADRPPRKKGRGLMQKMEKLCFGGATHKTQPQSHGNEAKILISGPQLQKGFDEDKLQRLNCVDLIEFRDTLGSPLFSSFPPSGSASPSDPSSAVSTPSPVTRVRSHRQRGPAPNQSPMGCNQKHRQMGNLMIQVPDRGHKPTTFPPTLPLSLNVLSPIDNTSVNWRTGSFHGYRGRRCLSSGGGSTERSPLAQSPLATPSNNRVSFYENVPNEQMGRVQATGTEDDDVFSALDSVMDRISSLQQLVCSWADSLSSDDADSDSARNSGSSPCPPSPKDIHLEIKKHLGTSPTLSEDDLENRSKTSGESESVYVCYAREQPSLQHKRLGPLCWSSEQKLGSEAPAGAAAVGIEWQPATHINMLQKLSLLKLTALMDQFSPSSKQGWSWTVPKTMRRTKAQDYKDRRVFGVPLLQSAQQTGYPLPLGILKAMLYLRTEGFDQVGLFRKSGVKSRIQSLREMVEADPTGVSFQGQSAFDVADMVKQYFRDLPEPIFSSKLCESFLQIYQYFPKEEQFAAVQATIFLLPDENREALHTLLLFLNDVVSCAAENQMTPTNVAVCLAPSLFHLNTLKRDSTTISRSSHRKYSLGRPDQRDLSENLAATQGLAHMVAESSLLFQVPRGWRLQTQGALRDEAFQPADGMHDPPNMSGNEKQGGRVLLDLCIQDVLSEAREKFRCWTRFSCSDNTELAFKKGYLITPVPSHIHTHSP
ncbi:hypothetical protein GJAV_G00135400 [Gymnothorax javanicus]|nr:hypothetical protein GJAV_G00135400 [Gymnothorax javanicus]